MIRLAKEQDFLSIEDINQALPGEFDDIEVIDDLVERLRTMERLLRPMLGEDVRVVIRAGAF